MVPSKNAMDKIDANILVAPAVHGSQRESSTSSPLMLPIHLNKPDEHTTGVRRAPPCIYIVCSDRRRRSALRKVSLRDSRPRKGMCCWTTVSFRESRLPHERAKNSYGVRVDSTQSTKRLTTAVPGAACAREQCWVK